MNRTIVAERDGFALAELLDDDLPALAAADDGAFEVDPDDRPVPYEITVQRLGVLDAEAGELVGAVSWHAVGYGRTAACAAWNIGIGLLPAARGRRAGSTALRLLVEHLFASTDVDRIEAETDVENLPAQRALRSAGLRMEGTVRGAQLRGGIRRDMLSYSVLRDELTEPTGDRVLVASHDGVALAEPTAGERQYVAANADAPFGCDPDERPLPFRLDADELAVLDAASGELYGLASWRAVPHGPTRACAAWNVGLALLPTARGRGVGTSSLRLLVRHLFASTDLDRVEAGTDVANLAGQRVARAAGMRLEGLVRGAHVRDGERRPYLAYSILRSELEQHSDGSRVIVARRAGVALAQRWPKDDAEVHAGSDHAFDLDRDDRPPPFLPSPSHHVTVLDADSGAVLGLASWHAVDYGGSAASAAWNIGLQLLPGERGRGVGGTAARLLAEHLFATTDLDRVEAGTDVANVAAQRALDKAGFHRDGVVRGAQLRDGLRRDMVLYGLLRTDL